MEPNKLEIFKTKNKEWCWRVLFRNGKEWYRCSETHKRLKYCRQSADDAVLQYWCWSKKTSKAGVESYNLVREYR